MLWSNNSIYFVEAVKYICCVFFLKNSKDVQKMTELNFNDKLKDRYKSAMVSIDRKVEVRKDYLRVLSNNLLIIQI